MLPIAWSVSSAGKVTPWIPGAAWPGRSGEKQLRSMCPGEDPSPSRTVTVGDEGAWARAWGGASVVR